MWQSFSTPTRWFNRLTTPMDAHRFAVSEEVKRSMSRGAAKGTEVLLHGIDHASFQAGGESRSTVRASLGISADTVVAITVANLRTEKDYPNLLHAAATACDREPRLLFLAVGQGPLESEVRALHTELGLAGRFVLMGFRDDVPDLLRAADLFVLGSAHEGLPVAIMEAMAAGLPVAATDVGGVAEAVVDDETGILVPPSDSEALATAILHVARDSGLRRRMSEAAVARSKLFDIRTAVDAQERVYDALLAP